MNSSDFAVPAYSRLNPNALTFRKPPSEKPAPTKVQSAVEIGLFTVFGLSLAIAAIAFVALNSPSHRSVPNSVAAGLAAGRVNILLIGMTKVPPPDGDGIEMATDSMTMLSVHPGTHQVAMVAIPPDLWLRVGHFGMHRLASAQTIGESSGYPGEGPALAIDTIQKATGQPIHGFVRMDDSALQSVIDAIGGVDVVVRNGFYERRARRTFTAGPLHLDGKTAILFASPYVDNEDRFEREARQQQLLGAVMTKVIHLERGVRTRALAVPASAMNATNLSAAQFDQLCEAAGDRTALRYVSLRPLVDTVQVESISEKAGPAVTPHDGDFARIRALASGLFGGAGEIASRPQTASSAASMVAAR